MSKKLIGMFFHWMKTSSKKKLFHTLLVILIVILVYLIYADATTLTLREVNKMIDAQKYNELEKSLSSDIEKIPNEDLVQIQILSAIKQKRPEAFLNYTWETLSKDSASVTQEVKIISMLSSQETEKLINKFISSGIAKTTPKGFSPSNFNQLVKNLYKDTPHAQVIIDLLAAYKECQINYAKTEILKICQSTTSINNATDYISSLGKYEINSTSLKKISDEYVNKTARESSIEWEISDLEIAVDNYNQNIAEIDTKISDLDAEIAVKYNSCFSPRGKGYPMNCFVVSKLSENEYEIIIDSTEGYTCGTRAILWTDIRTINSQRFLSTNVSGFVDLQDMGNDSNGFPLEYPVFYEKKYAGNDIAWYNSEVAGFKAEKNIQQAEKKKYQSLLYKDKSKLSKLSSESEGLKKSLLTLENKWKNQINNLQIDIRANINSYASNEYKKNGSTVPPEFIE